MPNARPQSRSTWRARARFAATGVLAAALLIGGAVGVGVPGSLRPLARLLPVPGGHATAEPCGSDLLKRLPQPPAGDDKRKLPLDSDAYRDARKLLPDRFLEYETTRFVVLSDARPRWSQQQAQLLERTWLQYNRFTRMLRTSPQPLRHKLVCVLFQEHEDYRAFARTNDKVTADWISGYYSPRGDRIVFYNIETNPDFAEARRDVQPDDVLASADEVRHAAAARSRLSEDYRKAATATVVHEAVHQLAFHTRLQTPHLQNPLWLSEGLATAFETDNPNHAFGPDCEYELREQMFRQLLDEHKLIPLRELVTYTQMPDNADDTITAVYHESYSLMTWLARFRRSQLRRYFASLLDEPPGRPTPKRQLDLFEKAFGDIDRLERAWLHYESDRR